jgi:hypothetical protein
MSDLKRWAKMNPTRKYLLTALATYLSLWALTWIMQPSAGLQKHIQNTEIHPPTETQFDSFSAVAPLLVFAEWRWGFGDLGQHGMKGWFIWTPFGNYTISSQETWIS